MTEPDVIDHLALANLLEMVGGDTAFLNEMIDEYFADTPKLITTMRQSIAETNAIELRRAAHSLKSNSSSFGAQALTELCRELEDRAKHGLLEDVHALVSQVEAEYATVKGALQLKKTTGYTL